MLVRLSLRDFAIVDAADIDFASGFTALSGETGAGKSILIDALGLALGSRADPTVVREGTSRAEISAEFEVDNTLDAWLDERALTGDAGLLIARRVIDSDGRSRAFINGHTVTATQLREAGQLLLDLHSQNATQAMLRADGQRDLLDRFAGLTDETHAVGQAFDRWKSANDKLELARSNQRSLALERERLEWQANEIGQLKLAPGEWEELSREQTRLSHSAALIDGAQSVAAGLVEDDQSVESRVNQMISKLRPLAAIDAALASALECLTSASINIKEAADTCADYSSRADLDPQRLDAIERRVSTVFAAARRLKLAPESLVTELDSLNQKLHALNQSSDIDALERQVASALAEYQQRAIRLSSQRQEVAGRFSKGVSGHLQSLGMKGASFQIGFETAAPSRHGNDRIEFRIAGHAGASVKPIAKVASGGELSRLGLAIAVEAAQANPLPTLIFDEADAGVGGAVAEVIGGLMRQLGQSRQVLCVTHLPQVAARAHQQYSVSKETANGKTLSRINPLAASERVEELARMLGGIEITATTRKHAREMLAANA